MTTEEKIADAYDKGFIDGLAQYAHWKDGVSFVGTCGTTLKKAKEDRKESLFYQVPKYL